MRTGWSLAMAGGALALCGAVYFWPDPITRGSDGTWADPLVERDLAAIAADTLRVLVIERHLTYERWPQAQTGLEFELLERFARQAGLRMKAVVVEHPDSLLPMLQRGEGDVIAAQLGRRSPLGRWVAHTGPYRYVVPVVATLRADRVLGIAPRGGSLEGRDTAWVSAWSPFAPSQRRWPGNDGSVDLSRPTVFTDTARYGDQPVINLSLGRIHAAIISHASAAYFAERMPQLAFSEPQGDGVPLVFALRRNAPGLLRAMNRWIADPQEKEARGMLMNAYGSHVPRRGTLGKARALREAGEALSPYDSLFMEHAGASGWDWELLAAIAFKESRFDTAAVSHRGAQGLMQMMPGTAAGLGTDSLHLAERQVQAAARYLAALDSIWMRTVPQPDRRLRFVLAAYNAGPGHVMDAQRLARSLGLDPLRWEGHVERAITLLALPRFFTRPEVQSGPCQGSQTFLYVREVILLYDQFRRSMEQAGLPAPRGHTA